MNKIKLAIILFAFTHTTYGQESFNLQEAIDYALVNSNEMKMAQLDIEDAEAQITEFKAIGMPQLDAGINYQYYMAVPVNPVQDFITPSVYDVLEDEQLVPLESFEGPPEVFEFSFFQKNNLTANLNASWLLFDGSYLTGLRGARMFRDLNKKAVDVKAEKVRSNVTKAYMNILIAEENKKTLEKNIANINKSLNEAEAFYENGFLEKLDVDRILLSLENVSTEKEKIDQIIDISYNLLKFQMSYPLENEISITEDLETLVNLLKIENADLEETIDFNKRAEFAQIEMGEDLNELNIERLKKGYLPNLRARANVNESLQRNNLFDGDEIGFIPQASVSLGLNIPIFDGNQKKGQIQQAKIEQERIGIQKSEFQRAVSLQVANARMQYINAKKTLSNRERALNIVEDIYKTTQIKFKEGVGSSLEVTQAESQLFSAQANYISALYDLLITKTDLDIALGNI
ncbi:MAG: TolC family protein [Saprospiraceae bacterium]|nr:TolC family protein [Saprospiraceae bacterium]